MNIHRSKMNKPQCFGIDERRYIPVTDFAAHSNGSIHRKGREERKAQLHKSLYLEEIFRPGTRMPRIKRIFTDPCASASTVAPVDVAHTYGCCHTWRSVFYRTPPIIDHDKKPQMNADERRFVAINHRKGREERKAEVQKSLRPLRSLRLINFHGIPTAQGNKATVVFQTGFTGSTGW